MNTSRGTDRKMKEWIAGLVGDFINSSDNTLSNSGNDRAFTTPIIGYARGDDPVFEQFKRDIGPFHMTPVEAFEIVYPGTGVKADELTVISWVLPHIQETKIDNRKQRKFPAERWVRGKKFGVVVNAKLQSFLIKAFAEAGYRAMAPGTPPHWSEQMSPNYGYASTWSERHAAYAAGLGTFGLCDGLITPVGKAMRCGSLIVQMRLTPTERPYTSHTEYCLFLSEGVCGACIKRCPVGAITAQGHDKVKCRAHVDGACADYAQKTFALETNVCGLCQTKVPCESGIPMRAKAGTQGGKKPARKSV